MFTVHECKYDKFQDIILRKRKDFCIINKLLDFKTNLASKEEKEENSINLYKAN